MPTIKTVVITKDVDTNRNSGAFFPIPMLKVGETYDVEDYGIIHEKRHCRLVQGDSDCYLPPDSYHFVEGGPKVERPIIESIFDNDLYKFSMQAAVLWNHLNVPVTYRFTNRRPGGKFTQRFKAELDYQIQRMANLRATEEEIVFLANKCPYLPRTYFDYIRNYQFDPGEVRTWVRNGELGVEIAGSWDSTILWEVPLMAIISELYFRIVESDPLDELGWYETYANRLGEKARLLKNVKFADFGTRRRRCAYWQSYVNGFLTAACKTDNFVGTSNVALARINDLRPIGTMAHEWIMGISAIDGLRHANRFALNRWQNTFHGRLGIALTDTYGVTAFLEDFGYELARAFDGVRHDSGDPLVFAERIIKHYESLDVDPKSKTIVFSDGLTPETVQEIEDHIRGRIRSSYGIGTNLTNDFGTPALNMVIKMTSCNGVPVVKLSDVPGKATYEDRDAYRVARWTFYKQPLD